jgi:hypothetical protein
MAIPINITKIQYNTICRVRGIPEFENNLPQALPDTTPRAIRRIDFVSLFKFY